MASIFFLPTCTNCGNILYGSEIGFELDTHEHERDLYSTKDVVYPISYSITPPFCPYCHEIFHNIVVTEPTYECRTPEYYKKFKGDKI